MTDPILAAVVAVAKNGVIGRNGDLPWRIPSDLKRFKEATLGKPVIMGRKTWESLPRKPLPGRANYVISSTLPGVEGAQVFADAEEALEAATREAQRAGVDEVCLIGGAQLYADLLERTQRLYLTEVDLEPEGDARFPALDPQQWRLVRSERVERGERDDAGFTVKVLDRVATA
ncbi:MAG: dihydrofolate reductase [Alphaproteobacteria bacterium]|nr:dihydrofolate reductase [Alphaproteobacteria bacterium]